MRFPDESMWVCDAHVVFGGSVQGLWDHVKAQHDYVRSLFGSY